MTDEELAIEICPDNPCLGPAPEGVIINRGRSRWYNKDRVR